MSMSDLCYVRPGNKKFLKKDSNKNSRSKNKIIIREIIKDVNAFDELNFFNHDTVVNPWVYD